MTQKPKHQPSRRDLLKWMGAGALASVPLLSYGTLETGWVSVERYELPLPRWDADGFRVALLSDLHSNSPFEAAHAAHAIRLAIAEKPDLIAIPGDFVNRGDDTHIQFVRDSLEPIHEAKCPVIASLGNHDYESMNVLGVKKAIEDSSATLLQNHTVDVQGVTVAGLDDALAGYHRTEFLADPKFSKSLLVLLHEPDFVSTMPSNVSLQVSGHTHGGQICAPGGIPLHTPIGGKKYVVGHYPDAKVPLFVTRGIGTVGFRLRTFCRPEVSILTLRAA